MSPKREELIERLKKLAQSEPPKNLASALCYAQGPSQPRPPCPHCRDRWTTPCRKEEAFKPHQGEFYLLERYRELLDEIRETGFDATLEVPEHCEFCGRGLLRAPFVLAVRYSDFPEPLRLTLESPTDLVMMCRFLRGEDRYSKMFGDQPLKNVLLQLCGLFGISALPELCEILDAEVPPSAEPEQIRRLVTSRKFRKQWRALTSLTLHGPWVDAAWIREIGKIKPLRKLDLSDCVNLRRGDIRPLRSLSSLRMLQLDRCTGIGNEDLRFLKGLPLDELSLCEMTQLDDAALEYVAQIATLRRINLSGCDKITQKGVASLLQMPGLTQEGITQ